MLFKGGRRIAVDGVAAVRRARVRVGIRKDGFSIAPPGLV